MFCQESNSRNTIGSIASWSDPVWPDLAKTQHFTSTLKNFGHFERVQLVFGKVSSVLWPILYAAGPILIVENGKLLKNNLASVTR